MLSYSEAKQLSKSGNIIPLFKKVPSDLDTPVTAFMKLAGKSKYSFLLESIEGGEKLARYSFIGFDPFLILSGNNESVQVEREGKKHVLDVPAIQFLSELFKVYSPVQVEGLPRFTGGGVGYFAYDAIRWYEKIPDQHADSLGLPETMFGLYSRIVVFDHLKQEMLLVANILHDQETTGFQKKYNSARKAIEEMHTRLLKPIGIKKSTEIKSRSTIIPECEQKQFEKMVRRAKKYIKEGDIFQVVLSQRWCIKSKDKPLTVYRRLRRINPSPYMFMLNFGDTSVIGASPEMLVRIEGDQIETRPIAGTRRRGKNAKEDLKLIKELLADEKELAEHTMLLDLGRNDVGRVSRPGSVNVKEQMIIEKYSHVIHIVSSVTGKLKRTSRPIDGHFACFPAGTVSGAPKIRAMEIIDELEPSKRGIYAGTVAYLDFWGNLDSCIAIRTVVKDGHNYYVQAGAGIVADSKPAREFNETVAKATAIIQAVTGDNK